MLRQGDLFTAFPVRRPISGRPAADLSLRIKTAMGEALKACPDSAEVVALRMSEITGRPVTGTALYAYTAPSKPEHDLGIAKFVAFVRATGATWLWDELLCDDGLTVLEGPEARLAQLGLLKQEEQRIASAKRAIERELQADPVEVKQRRRR